MAEKKKIWVVGSGFVGHMTVYYLTQHMSRQELGNTEFHLIDKRSGVGRGLSFGNGGFLSANSFETICVPSPDVVDTKFSKDYTEGGWLSSKDRKLSPVERHWVNSVKKCGLRPETTKNLQRQIYHLFSFTGINMLREFMDEFPDIKKASAFRYRGNSGTSGVLKIYRPEVNDVAGSVKEDVAFLKSVGGDGIFTNEISAEKARRYDPGVANYIDNEQRKGSTPGFLMQHGGNCNPFELTSRLSEYLQSLGNVYFRSDTEVVDIKFSNRNTNHPNCIEGLITADNTVLGSFTDRYVFAAGSEMGIWSQFGIKAPPIMGITGASLTVPVPEKFIENGTAPKNQIKLVDSLGGPVIIPFTGADGKQYVRVGGYTTFEGMQPIRKGDKCARFIFARQYHMLEEFYPQVAKHFLEEKLRGNLENLSSYEGVWLGARPVTADNKAIVGQALRIDDLGELVDVPNAWFNMGHGAAGITLSAPTGSYLAQLICGLNPQLPGLFGYEEKLQEMLSPRRWQAHILQGQELSAKSR